MHYMGSWKPKHLSEMSENPTTIFGTEYVHPLNYAPLLANMLKALGFHRQENENYEEAVRRTLRGKKILEIGARHGVFVDFLNKHGAHAKGIEISESAAKIARQKGIAVRRKDAQTLDEKNTYDAIVSHGFFSSAYWDFLRSAGMPTPSIRTIHDRVTQALKPGGFAIHTSNEPMELEATRQESRGMEFLTVRKQKTNKINEIHVSVARRIK